MSPCNSEYDFFGNRIFADVIKNPKMNHLEYRMMASLSLGEEMTQGNKHTWKKKPGEYGGRDWSPTATAKRCHEPQETGRD